MGTGINYFEPPFSTVDGNHEYATASFVEWFVKSAINFGGNFTSLRGMVAGMAMVSSAETSLDNYLRDTAKTTLLEEYSWFKAL